MSAIRQANSKSLMLFSGRAYPELTTEIAGHLGVTPTPTASYEFANGELFVRFEESVRGCDAAAPARPRLRPPRPPRAGRRRPARAEPRPPARTPTSRGPASR